MSEENNDLIQIVFTLAKHFECIYFVDLTHGNYTVFTGKDTDSNLDFPSEGKDFFADAAKNAGKYVHPSDLDIVVNAYVRETILANLSENDSYTIPFRAVVNGKVEHMRHVITKSYDGKHIVCCLENIEQEYLEKEEQKNHLRSANILARRDELTGVKNSNAFQEYSEEINKRIRDGAGGHEFGVVMCDINNLKQINDTRGHNYGDEAIRAASRMICEVFQHSPVFRIGGDEFVVVLSGNDFHQKESLMKKLREESDANRKLRSGPVVASGIALIEKGDRSLAEVLERADKLMYENKKELKVKGTVEAFENMERISEAISDERKRLLDAMFGALITVAGGGYIYLNDMRYDFSRWSVSLTDDFGLESEYMYHADRIWLDYIHPDDVEVYRDAVNSVLFDGIEIKPISYRARKPDGSYVLLYTRGFVLSDSNGEPEYFGGIIIPDE